MGKKHKNSIDEGWMTHLRERPELAAELIEEVQGNRIAEIEEIYSDVITAFKETKAKLNALATEMVASRNRLEEENEELPEGWSDELEKAYDEGEKEWYRLCHEFHVNYGSRYDEYERELAPCEDTFGKLRFLLSV
jgi:hypothetical protein